MAKSAKKPRHPQHANGDEEDELDAAEEDGVNCIHIIIINHIAINPISRAAPFL